MFYKCYLSSLCKALTQKQVCVCEIWYDEINKHDTECDTTWLADETSWTSLAQDWRKSMKLLTHLSGYFQYKHCSLHIHVWLFIEWGAPSLLMSKHAKCLAWVQLSFVDKTESKTVLLPNYWSCSLMAKSCSKTRMFPSVLQSSESRALASFICFSNPFKVLEKLLVCVCFICAL